jgi:hypothetical protein
MEWDRQFPDALPDFRTKDMVAANDTIQPETVIFEYLPEFVQRDILRVLTDAL